MVFEPMAPPGNGNRLGVVQETIAPTVDTSPKSLPHSSSGRLLVMMVIGLRNNVTI
jgi:hypothetical protein